MASQDITKAFDQRLSESRDVIFVTRVSRVSSVSRSAVGNGNKQKGRLWYL